MGKTPGIPQISSQHLPQIQRLQSSKTELNPYKIFVPKKFDEKTLRYAYLKAAVKTHPRFKEVVLLTLFQKVSIAYTLLEHKLKDPKNNHSHSCL